MPRPARLRASTSGGPPGRARPTARLCRDPRGHAGDLVVRRLDTRPLRLLAPPERPDSRIMVREHLVQTPREHRPDWLNLQVSGESHKRLPDRAQHKIRTLLCECPIVGRGESNPHWLEPKSPSRCLTSALPGRTRPVVARNGALFASLTHSSWTASWTR